jgi:hypothetical protein
LCDNNTKMSFVHSLTRTSLRELKMKRQKKVKLLEKEKHRQPRMKDPAAKRNIIIKSAKG